MSWLGIPPFPSKICDRIDHICDPIVSAYDVVKTVTRSSTHNYSCEIRGRLHIFIKRSCEKGFHNNFRHHHQHQNFLTASPELILDSLRLTGLLQMYSFI